MSAFESKDDLLLKVFAPLGVDWLTKKLGKSKGQIINRAYKLRISLAAKPRELKPARKPSTMRNYVPVKDRVCEFPPFYPVLLGLYPQSRFTKSELWRKRRQIILKVYDECCVYCGDYANTVDHIIPLDLGGTDDFNNLVAACARCNYSKGNKIKKVVFNIV